MGAAAAVGRGQLEAGAASTRAAAAALVTQAASSRCGDPAGAGQAEQGPTAGRAGRGAGRGTASPPRALSAGAGGDLSRLSPAAGGGQRRFLGF